MNKAKFHSTCISNILFCFKIVKSVTSATHISIPKSLKGARGGGSGFANPELSPKCRYRLKNYVFFAFLRYHFVCRRLRRKIISFQILSKKVNYRATMNKCQEKCRLRPAYLLLKYILVDIGEILGFCGKNLDFHPDITFFSNFLSPSATGRRFEPHRGEPPHPTPPWAPLTSTASGNYTEYITFLSCIKIC